MRRSASTTGASQPRGFGGMTPGIFLKSKCKSVKSGAFLAT